MSAGDKMRQSAIAAMYGDPVVSSVSPGQGPAAGGTPVTVQGRGFAQGTRVIGSGAVAPQEGVSVSFGTTAATDVKVLSDTAIQCVAPASATYTR